jgi:hypothetical protein
MRLNEKPNARGPSPSRKAHIALGDKLNRKAKEPPDPSGKNVAEEIAAGPPEHGSIMMTAHEQLPAVIAKISRMLAVKPEYFVTHPSELRVVRALSDAELREVVRQNGWRFVRRVGGRQVEFYNDAGVGYRPM